MGTVLIIKKTNSRAGKLKKTGLKEKVDRKFSPKAFGILKNSLGKKKSADIISKIRKKWR